MERQQYPNRSSKSSSHNSEKKEQSKIRKQVSFKDANWGRRKGGETTRRKHPQILKTGRDIARRERKSQQYRFPMNIELTEEIAEIIGAFIGDGFTNKYNRTGMTQFTGDAKLDYQYITQHLVRLFEEDQSRGFAKN
jgi:hypothetical protein